MDCPSSGKHITRGAGAPGGGAAGLHETSSVIWSTTVARPDLGSQRTGRSVTQRMRSFPAAVATAVARAAWVPSIPRGAYATPPRYTEIRFPVSDDHPPRSVRR